MKLLVLNSPSYLEKITNHENENLDPLSENFTNMYFNLMKFGLVNDVYILPRPTKIINQKAKKSHVFKFDKRTCTLNIVDEKDFEALSKEGRNIIYSWSNWNESLKYKNENFIIVNAMMNNIIHKNKLTKENSNYCILENPSLRMTLPDHLLTKWSASPLIQNLTLFNNFNIKNEYKYDWIMISTLAERKRVKYFIERLVDFKNKTGKELSGVFCTWGLNHLKKHSSSNSLLRDYEYIKRKIEENNLNVDILFDVSIEDKVSLMSKSKIFLNLSREDWGPRTLAESCQIGIPVITTPVGGSSFVISGYNGEVISEKEKENICNYIIYVKERIDVYKENAIALSSIFKEENLYPQIVKDIQRVYKEFYNE